MSPGPVPCAVDPGSVIEFKVLFCIQRSDRTRWPETFRCLNISHSNRNAPSAAVVKFYLSLFPALFLPTLSHINHVYMHQFLHVETKLGQIVFFFLFCFLSAGLQKKKAVGWRTSLESLQFLKWQLESFHVKVQLHSRNKHVTSVTLAPVFHTDDGLGRE